MTSCSKWSSDGLQMAMLPSGNFTKSYWKWSFSSLIYPLHKMVIFYSYVSLSEGNGENRWLTHFRTSRSSHRKRYTTRSFRENCSRCTTSSTPRWNGAKNLKLWVRLKLGSQWNHCWKEPIALKNFSCWIHPHNYWLLELQGSLSQRRKKPQGKQQGRHNEEMRNGGKWLLIHIVSLSD